VFHGNSHWSFLDKIFQNDVLEQKSMHFSNGVNIFGTTGINYAENLKYIKIHSDLSGHAPV
jgi:hypothetical protein